MPVVARMGGQLVVGGAKRPLIRQLAVSPTADCTTPCQLRCRASSTTETPHPCTLEPHTAESVPGLS
jgi:hypothetical protein